MPQQRSSRTASPARLHRKMTLLYTMCPNYSTQRANYDTHTVQTIIYAECAPRRRPAERVVLGWCVWGPGARWGPARGGARCWWSGARRAHTSDPIRSACVR
eukprot:5189812-Prymnesium_polylepis.1